MSKSNIPLSLYRYFHINDRLVTHSIHVIVTELTFADNVGVYYFAASCIDFINAFIEFKRYVLNTFNLFSIQRRNRIINEISKTFSIQLKKLLVKQIFRAATVATKVIIIWI